MMYYDEDDDDFISVGLYENGTWVWDDEKNELRFDSADIGEAPEIFDPTVTAIVVKDMDIIQQQKFKKRIQRKFVGTQDVVTLQDVKDLVLYTIPITLLSPAIIHIVHSVSAERFLRALILYCQYYAQIRHKMKLRTDELDRKLRTLHSDIIEASYKENLKDLRLLLGKEYCNMLLGAGDFRKFHHKGQNKNLQKMSQRFETLMKLATSIAWISLGRKNYEEIEIEVNRLFRSKKYNIVEHRNDVDADERLSETEKKVLRGDCLHTEKLGLIDLHTPVYDEVTCKRDIDFRLLSLGLTKIDGVENRLQKLEKYLSLSEYEFSMHGISLGIIGLPRHRFDTILREVRPEASENASATVYTHSQTMLRNQRRSRTSIASKKSLVSVKLPLFTEVELPAYDKTQPKPTKFSGEPLPKLQIHKVQFRRWLERVKRAKSLRK